MATAFSYAQAAKGQVPATVNVVGSKPENEGHQPMPDPQVTTRKSPQQLSSTTPSTKDSSSSKDAVTPESASSEASTIQPAKEQSASTTSGTMSPSFGTESAATLSKEDDIAGTANDSSESTTWEKLSQESQAGDKAMVKAEGDSDDSKLTTWEHVSAPQLREAPPPAVNPWLKRAQDAQAKVRESKGTEATVNTPAPTNTSIKNNPAMTGVRKKGRASVSDATSQKTSARLVDGRSHSDDGGASRKHKAAGETKVTSRLPPPSSDAVSWPTPDLAIKDERKSLRLERSDSPDQDKDRAANAKHGKKEWVSMLFVPTPVFNTPLPTGRRGGRSGGRGGKDATSSRGGSAAAIPDRPDEPEAEVSSPNTATERNKGESTTTRQASGTPRQKRMSNASQAKPRDLKKVEDLHEHGRTVLVEQPSVRDRDTSKDRRRTVHKLDATPGEYQSPSSSGARVAMANGTGVDTDSTFQATSASRHFSDKRGDYTTLSRDFSRDTNSMPREGRSERGGRGGYRVRGNHAGFPDHHNQYSDGAQYQHSSSIGAPKSHYSEPRYAPQQGYTTGRESRHYRAGSRSFSNPSQGMMGRYSPYSGSTTSFPPPPPVQTDVAAGYDYPAGPTPQFYHPYMQQAPLVGMVMEQMRYWFSLQNLVKDVYLRSRMDDQGFVPLSFMMPWRRMKQMTEDIKLVRFACQQVPDIELYFDTEGREYIRKSQDWDQWCLPREDRLPEARNAGPKLQVMQPFSSSLPDPSQHMFSQQLSPFMPQQGFQPNAIPFRPMMNDRPLHLSPSRSEGMTNGHANESPTHQTPLSAAVPEFTPNSQVNTDMIMANDDVVVNGNDAFADSQIENLTIVVRKPGMHTPTGTTSQSLLNGLAEHMSASDLSSISKSFPDATANVITNFAAPLADPSESPFTSKIKKPVNRTPNIFWVKDKDQPTGDLPSDLTHELYVVFRASALKQREQAPKGQCPKDMDVLFQFWSHFLARNFNTTMYNEFRNLAVDDAEERDTTIGLRNLITFYHDCLLSKGMVPARLAEDWLALVRNEAGNEETPAYDRLKSLWRNGAFPIKNRKRLIAFIEPELRCQLDE